MLKYLFLCSAGEDRSPTAVNVAKRLAGEKGLEIEANYRGLSNIVDYANYLPEYFRLFDKIFVMEKWMEEIVVSNDYPSNQVFCLDINDGPSFGDDKLISDLEKKLRKLI